MRPGGRWPSGGGLAGGWLRLARLYAGTAIGGYLLLMAVVILYYYGVARVGGAFIESAFTGCALLIALTTPVFALASWLTVGRRDRPPGAAARPPGAPRRPLPDPPAPRPTPAHHRCRPRCVIRLNGDVIGNTNQLITKRSCRRAELRAGRQRVGVVARNCVTAAVNSAGRSRCGECPQPGSTCSVYRPPAAR